MQGSQGAYYPTFVQAVSAINNLINNPLTRYGKFVHGNVKSIHRPRAGWIVEAQFIKMSDSEFTEYKRLRRLYSEQKSL